MLLEFKDKMDLLSNCTHSLQNTYIKFYFDETSAQGLVHWEDPEGWDGEGGRRGDQDGEHM